jgi:hypothetical protein
MLGRAVLCLVLCAAPCFTLVQLCCGLEQHRVVGQRDIWPAAT